MRWRAHELAFSIAAEVLGAEDLHFGWFEPGEEATVDNLRVAQRRYTERLLALIPDDAHRVLDVGCGTGRMLERLLAEGREVEGLAPNPELLAKTRDRVGPEVPLHEVRFEAFHTDRPFDAVLMAESHQLIPRKKGLRACVRTLKPGGRLVLADVFRMRPLPRPYLSRGGHRRAEFVQSAVDSGFEFELDEDITEAVLPTLALYHELLSQKVIPALDSALRFFQRSSPRLTRIVRPFVRRRLTELRNRYLHQDPETFRSYRSYRVMRLRLVR